MEFKFSEICRNIAQRFADFADAYEKDKLITSDRLDNHEKEITDNIKTKRKILAVLQEDLND